MSSRSDEVERPEPKGIPPVVAIFGTLAVLLFGLLAGGTLVYFLRAERTSTQQVELVRAEAEQARAQAADAEVKARAAEPSAQRPALMSREEFKAKVMGKTPEQVIEAVGRPDRTLDVGDQTRFYEKRTSTR
jgi:hypothetical protein